MYRCSDEPWSKTSWLTAEVNWWLIEHQMLGYTRGLSKLFLHPFCSIFYLARRLGFSSTDLSCFERKPSRTKHSTVTNERITLCRSCCSAKVGQATVLRRRSEITVVDHPLVGSLSYLQVQYAATGDKSWAHLFRIDWSKPGQGFFHCLIKPRSSQQSRLLGIHTLLASYIRCAVEEGNDGASTVCSFYDRRAGKTIVWLPWCEKRQGSQILPCGSEGSRRCV